MVLNLQPPMTVTQGGAAKGSFDLFHLRFVPYGD